ncbi:MAG: flavodoxin family protein [Bacteroidales bacterium]|nr:flavodoxin family protein [Bacteroidales bacterium]
MKKVLIICGSPRKGGNSDLLAGQFARGAAESGNEVETVYLRDLKIDYCIGCLACQRTGSCFQKDDANSLLGKMLEADVVCFSCPVYYYSVSGQMKVFIDRMNPLYGHMAHKDFYYMVTAQDESHTQLDRAMDAMEGFADCFEDIRRCGRIYGGGAVDKGDIVQLPAYQEAYAMGRNI